MSSTCDRAPVRINRPVSVVVFAISILFATPLFVWLGASPSFAAERGPGYGLTAALSYQGAHAYCVQLTQPSPVGNETRELPADEPLPEPLTAMTEDDRARLHWAIATLGASTDARDTAAVALYAWYLAEPEVFEDFGADSGALMNAIPEAEVAQVRSRFAQLKADGAHLRAVRVSGSVSVQLRRIDGELHLQVSQPPQHSEVRVELEGAEFTDGDQQRSFTAATTVTLNEQIAAEPLLTAAPDATATDGGRGGIATGSSDATMVTASYQLQYVPGYWSPDVRPLVTTDAQLIVAAADDFPKHRIEVEPDATPMPSPPPSEPNSDEADVTAAPEPPEQPAEPPVVEAAEQLDPAEPDESATPNEPATPDESDTPDESAAAEPTATIKPTETPTPTAPAAPTATPTGHVEPQQTSAPVVGPEQRPKQRATDTAHSNLPETGANFDPASIMLPLGLALTLIALGGYALTRSRAAAADPEGGR